MKLRLFSLCVVLCVSILGIGGQPGRAQSLQPLQPQDPDWLVRMYEDGWQKVQEGVLQRGEGGGQLETFTYGEEGLRWTVARWQKQVSLLESRYNDSPSEDLAKIIDWLRGEIFAANARLDSGQVGEVFNGEQMDECSLTYDAHAYAEPLSGSQAPGVTARADAYWHSNCGLIGNAYAYAYVEGAYNTVFSTKSQEDPKYNSDWVDAAAQWSLTPVSSSCFSLAYARAWSETLNIGREAEIPPNYSCPAAPLQVTVSGPASVVLDSATPCKDVTWTASVSGGITPYSAIDWYLGTTYVGTGSSYTKNYCSTTDETVIAKATVNDSDGQTASGTTTTTITPPLQVAVSGPGSVALDSSTPCKDITWTASVSGGVAPYGTINWYLGTSTTVVGTGSSYTKNYCSSELRTFTAKATVNDSAGQTASGTKTTTITPPLQVTVSGPTSVALDSATPCKDVTWTASVSGGVTPYGAIDWYLGTTYVGTGSSYTKNYCSTTTQTVTATATVTDSAAQTASGAKTTTITPPAPLQVTVRGPLNVDLDGTTPCKDVTWTASVSGGVTPYSIKWYLGTSTTIVGTGTSYTKNYCRTTQTVTPKATVSDGAGQTVSDTKTTKITYTPPSPLQVVVSGPTSVALDGTTTCQNVTWTATVSGGVTPYGTIKWYLGTSTTSVGTGTSFTKNYCTTNQTVTAKATVTDNASQTASGTKTTTITYTPPEPACSPSDCNCISSNFTEPENSPNAFPITQPCY